MCNKVHIQQHNNKIHCQQCNNKAHIQQLNNKIHIQQCNNEVHLHLHLPQTAYLLQEDSGRVTGQGGKLVIHWKLS